MFLFYKDSRLKVV